MVEYIRCHWKIQNISLAVSSFKPRRFDHGFKNSAEHCIFVWFYVLIMKSQRLELISCHAGCKRWCHQEWNQAICIFSHTLGCSLPVCLQACEWNAHQIKSISLPSTVSDVISICVLNPYNLSRCHTGSSEISKCGIHINDASMEVNCSTITKHIFETEQWNMLPAPGAAHIHTSATSSTSSCCAQIQQPPSAFGRGYGGCTPPGSSSAQVNLFMVAPLNPVRPR